MASSYSFEDATDFVNVDFGISKAQVVVLPIFGAYIRIHVSASTNSHFCVYCKDEGRQSTGNSNGARAARSQVCGVWCM